MEKKKVLHIIKSLGRGGAEILLQETMKIHNHEQFEFHCIYFLPWKNQMVEGISRAGGKVKLVEATNNISLLFKTRKVVDYIKANNIDIVHCHLPWAGFLGRIVSKIINIPVVYSEHNIQERYHWLTRLLNKTTFNWQTKAIAVSGDVAKSIKDNIRPRVPVSIILNGVNTDSFIRNHELGSMKKRELKVEPAAVLIGNIAVFRFQKRLKEWITVFKQIHQQYPHVRGCIIGDGILKEEILEHLRNEGMEDYIFFPGLQTDVIPWLSAIDIFMMSSSFEGLPIALLEAMSMQCAVVSTNAGGIKEVIRNGEDGFIESVDDWKSLVKPLDFLISHPDQIAEYGMKARKRVEDSFSLRTMVNQIEQLYQSLTENAAQWKS